MRDISIDSCGVHGIGSRPLGESRPLTRSQENRRSHTGFGSDGKRFRRLSPPVARGERGGGPCGVGDRVWPTCRIPRKRGCVSSAAAELGAATAQDLRDRSSSVPQMWDRNEGGQRDHGTRGHRQDPEKHRAHGRTGPVRVPSGRGSPVGSPWPAVDAGGVSSAARVHYGNTSAKSECHVVSLVCARNRVKGSLAVGRRIPSPRSHRRPATDHGEAQLPW